MSRHIHIALMAYDGTVPINQMVSFVQTVMKITGEKQWNASFHFRVGDSILPRSRNAELSNFVHNPDATDMIMIDADTVCSPEGIVQLLEHDADIVGAPYRCRNEPLVWSSVRWLHEDIKPQPNGLIEVEGIGTGMFRITKRAAQILWDAEPLEYVDPTAKAAKSRGVFWFEVENGHLWGEDIVICRKWRKLGGKVFTDPDIPVGHVGTHNFAGDLRQWLEAQPPELKIDDTTGRQTMVKNAFSKQSTGVAEMPLPQLIEAAA